MNLGIGVMKSAMGNIIKDSLANTMFVAKKYAPELLIGAGSVGTVVAAVVACKETTTAGEIFARHQKRVTEIHAVANGEIKLDPGEHYSDKDRKSDLFVTYAQTTKSLLKHYWKPILIEAVSLTAIAYGFNIKRKQFTIAATSLAALSTQLDGYRQRVKGEVGQQKEEQLFYDMKTKKVQQEVTDAKGKTKVVEKEVVDRRTANALPLNARLFYEENNILCSNDPNKNMMFIHNTEAFLNDKLKRRGHITAEEILNAFGYTGTAAMGGPSEYTEDMGLVYDRLHPNAETNFFHTGLGDSLEDVQFQQQFNDNCFVFYFNWYNIKGKIDWNYVDSDRYTYHLQGIKGF